jgi:hypothetical protein
VSTGINNYWHCVIDAEVFAFGQATTRDKRIANRAIGEYVNFTGGNCGAVLLYG